MDLLRQLLKNVFWGLVILGVALVGYSAYQRWEGRGEVNRTIEQIGGSALEKGRGYVSEYVDDVADKAKEGALDAVKNTVNSALSTVKEKIGSLQDSILGGGDEDEPKSNEGSGDDPPISSEPTAGSPGFLTPSPPATVSLFVGNPLSFAINQDQSGESIYSIDWGDGQIEEGNLNDEQSKLVNHSWGQAGDYSVKITIEKGSDFTSHTFPIRVYEEQ